MISFHEKSANGTLLHSNSQQQSDKAPRRLFSNTGYLLSLANGLKSLANSTKQKKDVCLFLSMPGEIRNLIYDYCSPLGIEHEYYFGLLTSCRQTFQELNSIIIKKYEHELFRMAVAWPHREPLRYTVKGSRCTNIQLLIEIPISVYAQRPAGKTIYPFGIIPQIPKLLSLQITRLNIEFYEDQASPTGYQLTHGAICGVIYDFGTALGSHNEHLQPDSLPEYAQMWVDCEKKISVRSKSLAIKWTTEHMSRSTAAEHCEHYQDCELGHAIAHRPMVKRFVRQNETFLFEFEPPKTAAMIEMFARAAVTARKRRHRRVRSFKAAVKRISSQRTRRLVHFMS